MIHRDIKPENYDVTPDGKSFVFLSAARSDAQLIFVHDWKLELDARVRAARR